MEEYKERICEMIQQIDSPSLLMVLIDLVKAMQKEWETTLS